MFGDLFDLKKLTKLGLAKTSSGCFGNLIVLEDVEQLEKIVANNAIEINCESEFRCLLFHNKKKTPSILT